MMCGVRHPFGQFRSALLVVFSSDSLHHWGQSGMEKPNLNPPSCCAAECVLTVYLDLNPKHSILQVAMNSVSFIPARLSTIMQSNCAVVLLSVHYSSTW